MTRRRARALLAGLFATALLGCGEQQGEHVIEGRPGGPYRMTLATSPAAPRPGELTELHWRLTHANDGSPLTGLQVAHERVVHNFIVARDFSAFAHIHHEDFRPLTDEDLRAARFMLPYTFPHAGHYRLVSDFTHRDRNWVKHFDLVVGSASVAPPVPPVADLTRQRAVDGYTATLETSPATPVTGYETELVVNLARDGLPVTDLALHLGSETHVAVWREDGAHFGHTHSYTPRVAAMIAAMHDRALDAETRARTMAEMMVKLACMKAEQVFNGPKVPVHYVFPEPGVYHLFFELAPGGVTRVFHFALAVEAYHTGMDTEVRSIVAPALPQP
ncbi:MAG: hypothetical protein K2Y51_16765 [Gammaproteobacteria bacterium]|nr:hypothetical protein [Gammaproteobacteria bacterium]